MRPVIILAALGMLASILGGCEVTVRVLECEIDTDCPIGEACAVDASGDKFDNQCVAVETGCFEDSDCGTGEFCFNRECDNICEDTEFFLRTASNPDTVCYPVSPCSLLTCDAGQICVPIKKEGAPADDAVCADITIDNSCEAYGVCCDGQDNSCSPADCYCDEACLQFGDCCADYIESCF